MPFERCQIAQGFARLIAAPFVLAAVPLVLHPGKPPADPLPLFAGACWRSRVVPVAVAAGRPWQSGRTPAPHRRPTASAACSCVPGTGAR
jgi:hypothetical protein